MATLGWDVFAVVVGIVFAVFVLCGALLLYANHLAKNKSIRLPLPPHTSTVLICQMFQLSAVGLQALPYLKLPTINDSHLPSWFSTPLLCVSFSALITTAVHITLLVVTVRNVRVLCTVTNRPPPRIVKATAKHPLTFAALSLPHAVVTFLRIRSVVNHPTCDPFSVDSQPFALLCVVWGLLVVLGISCVCVSRRVYFAVSPMRVGPRWLWHWSIDENARVCYAVPCVLITCVLATAIDVLHPLPLSVEGEFAISASVVIAGVVCCVFWLIIRLLLRVVNETDDFDPPDKQADFWFDNRESPRSHTCVSWRSSASETSSTQNSPV